MVMILPSTTTLSEKKMNVMPGIWLSQLLGNQCLDILVIWDAYRKTILRIPPKRKKNHTEKSSTIGSSFFPMASLTGNAGYIVVLFLALLKCTAHWGKHGFLIGYIWSQSTVQPGAISVAVCRSPSTAKSSNALLFFPGTHGVRNVTAAHPTNNCSYDLSKPNLRFGPGVYSWAHCSPFCVFSWRIFSRPIFRR